VKKSSDMPDLVVVGAGPAGAAAAALGAEAGLGVVLVEQRGAGVGSPGVDWLSRAGQELMKGIGCNAAEDRAGTIQIVRFADSMNGRLAEAKLDKAVDLVRSDALAKRLAERAARKGAAAEYGVRGRRIEAGEDRITLVVDDHRRITARLMITADGSSSALPREGRMSGDAGSGGVSRCVECLELAAGTAAKKSAEGSLTLLVDHRDPTTFGYLLDAAGATARGAVAQQDEARLRRTFSERLAAAVRHGWLAAAPPNAGAAAIRLVPRGAALDMETHVGKRRLVIGDAGGFVSAISQDGLYPALESARLAVEVCARALKAAHPQDVLAEFDPLWRASLADYLRMPNTDLRFLMPLVFTNQQMAGKLARAFVIGENI